MKRQVLALCLLGVLVVSAGCTGVFNPNGVNEDQVTEEYEYNWNTEQKVTINVTGDNYRAIYDLQNRSQLVLYANEFTGQEPLSISSLQFQYPNGTVTQIPASQVENRQEETVITLPARQGKVAFSAATGTGKQVTVPTFVTGSYEVILPPGMRVGVPVLSQISPGADSRTIENGRVHITWDEVEAGSVSVSYYLSRDIWIFGAVILLVVLIGAGGLAYYVLQLRRLERRREESGLDTGNNG